MSCVAARCVADGLGECDLKPTEAVRTIANDVVARKWDDIRDFLSIHFRFNTRRTTLFWQHCATNSKLGNATELVEFYNQHGPTALGAKLIDNESIFRSEGYWTMLVGQQVSTKVRHFSDTAALDAWRSYRRELHNRAQQAIPADQAHQLVLTALRRSI